mmetsp:Transcript_6846/g.10734  ORF Transcript_6846/g.10734 Transcript_6846/m.10734 type:complete len:156 (-) Transcript_6846:247-714(-)
MLQEEEKLEFLQRVVAEAKRRALEDVRKKEKDKQKSMITTLGLGSNPEDTEEFKQAVRVKTCLLFAEVEQEKKRQVTIEVETRKREAEAEEEGKKKRKFEEEKSKAWEETREERVSSWRTFVDGKRSKSFKIGGVKPPALKTEKAPPAPPTTNKG